MNTLLHKNWYKYLAIALIGYSLVGGLLFNVPRVNILNETIRNLYFHVPMWFGMTFLLLMSLVYSVRFLRTNNSLFDLAAEKSAEVALWFGFFGLLTGSMWARYTWGAWWVNDPKLNAAAIGVLIYLAYFILRGSVNDEDKKGRIAAVYNVFVFFLFVTLIYVIPRLTDSLHPGNGGNPAMSLYDNSSMDANMRIVFYPACIGWICMGCWMTAIKMRIALIERKKFELN